MSVKPTILLYNFEDKKRKNKIRAFCNMQGIRVRIVEKEEYDKTIGELMENESQTEPEFSKEAGGQEESIDFDEEMLVMCRLGRKMDLLLGYLRREKMRIPLKAVLTPVNQIWDSVRLYREIRAEHEQMTGR